VVSRTFTCCQRPRNSRSLWCFFFFFFFLPRNISPSGNPAPVALPSPIGPFPGCIPIHQMKPRTRRSSMANCVSSFIIPCRSQPFGRFPRGDCRGKPRRHGFCHRNDELVVSTAMTFKVVAFGARKQSAKWLRKGMYDEMKKRKLAMEDSAVCVVFI